MKLGTHVYALPPLDFGWEDLIPIDRYLERLQAEEEAVSNQGWQRKGPTQVEQFNQFLENGKAAARRVGWEGDFRDDPHVGFLPRYDSLLPYVVWKQDNNGTTFVVSPVPLPYLEDED